MFLNGVVVVFVVVPTSEFRVTFNFISQNTNLMLAASV
jgi:hypothetical protein